MTCHAKSLLGLSLFSASFVVFADTTGAVTTTYLSASDSKVKSEWINVLDLETEGTIGSGRWFAYIEGTSTSKAGTVSSLYGEAYADAGAATDSSGDGRIQISGLEYIQSVGSGELSVGLLYPTGFIESASWANDETSQFIGSSFVNIQTNGSPDYALGVGYSGHISQHLTYKAIISQAQGLAELNSSYSELFDNLDDYFIGGELAWKSGNFEFYTSIWGSTLDVEEHGEAGIGNNYGFNVSLGYENILGYWTVRAGFANKRVSEAAQFVGISWRKDWQNWSFGAGTSVTVVTTDLKDSQELDDRLQHEIYAKYQLWDGFTVTGSVQRIANAGFGAYSEVDHDPTITSLRFSYGF